MPTEWTPYVLGDDLDVTARYDREGDLKQADVTVNYNEQRYFSQEEYDDLPEYRKKRVDWDDVDEAFREYGNGASATLRFTPGDGTMRLSSISDISAGRGDWHAIRFLRALPAAEAAIRSLPTVEAVEPVAETATRHLGSGENVEIVD